MSAAGFRRRSFRFTSGGIYFRVVIERYKACRHRGLAGASCTAFNSRNAAAFRYLRAYFFQLQHRRIYKGVTLGFWQATLRAISEGQANKCIMRGVWLLQCYGPNDRSGLSRARQRS